MARNRLGGWNLTALKAREQRIRDIRKGQEPDPARHVTNLDCAWAGWYNGGAGNLLTVPIEEANKLSYYHELNGQEPDITATESGSTDDMTKDAATTERCLSELIGGLQNMIERGLLSETTLPDDMQWLEHWLEKSEDALAKPNETAAEWVVFRSRDTNNDEATYVDDYSIYETEADAKSAYSAMLTHESTYSAGYAQIKAGTEPHWTEGEE